MKVLVVGGGGREHAIIYKLKESKKVAKLYCVPGNFGINKIASPVPLKVMDKEGIYQFAKENKIDMVVVSPDDPLADGMVDYLEERGIRVFGPYKAAARLESSKIFAKSLMEKYKIPTAKYKEFETSKEAIDYVIKEDKYPIVIKADGLALGKGVIIASDFDEAKSAIIAMIDDRLFGMSSSKIIIEEFLEGPEITVLAFTDGKTIKPMPSSQDHKRAFDGDKGPNTGGMGAFSPSPHYTQALEKECMDKIFKPTLQALKKEKIKYKGVIYFGLMLTKEGPKLLEYNARFGDPETQCILPRLETDLFEIFNKIIDEKLSSIDIKWSDEASCCVVLASGGYPGAYETGFEITGISRANRNKTIVFHAGTKGQDKCLTSGGRVLGVTGLGRDLEEAIYRAYKSLAYIDFNKMHYRKDIGRKD